MASTDGDLMPVDTATLDDGDWNLIDEASTMLADRFVHGRHYVGAAIRTADGSVYTGLNVETNIGRAAVCAEPVAIGAAATDGIAEFETVVALRHPAPDEAGGPFVVAPCGVCREMVTDYGLDTWVIVPGPDDDPVKVRAGDLLPNKYIQSYRSMHPG